MKRSTQALVALAVLEVMILGFTALLILQISNGSWQAPDPGRMMIIFGLIGGTTAAAIALILVLGFLMHRRREQREAMAGASPPLIAVPVTLQLTRSLKREGLTGKPVRAELQDSALIIAGADGGRLQIDSTQVDRLRLGYISGKYGRFFEARLWRGHDGPVLKIEPVKSDAYAYGVLMRLFAAQIAARSGLTSIERGTTHVGAIITLALLLFPVIAYTVIALAINEGRELTGWITGGIFVWLFGLIAILHYRHQRPRPVQNLAELDSFLPPVP